MAINSITNQYKYAGRGPLDAKSLVKTFAELTSTTTWDVDGTSVAYNGMIVAVWLDSDITNNGIYFLHDPNVKTARATPDVTVTTNWHKLGGLNDLPGLNEQISTIQNELDTLKSNVEDLQKANTEVVTLFTDLPQEGVTGKLYVVAEDTATYIWHNGAYLLVGDDKPDIQIIMGGGPAA